MTKLIDQYIDQYIEEFCLALDDAGITCPRGHLLKAILTYRGLAARYTHYPAYGYTVTARKLL